MSVHFRPLLTARHQAVLHQLATHALPLSFFATHYGSLTDDFAYHPNIRNMHMSTIVDDDKCEVSWLPLCTHDLLLRNFSACLPVQAR